MKREVVGLAEGFEGVVGDYGGVSGCGVGAGSFRVGGGVGGGSARVGEGNANWTEHLPWSGSEERP